MKISKTVKLMLSVAVVAMFIGCGSDDDEKKDTTNNSSNNGSQVTNGTGENNSNNGNSNSNDDGTLQVSTTPFVLKIRPKGNNKITLYTNDKYAYNYDIDWGDGISDTGITSDKGVLGSKSHTYPNSEIYTISITGIYPAILLGCSSHYLGTPISVEQWGDTIWQTMEGAFEYCSELTINAQDTPNLSQVTNMNNMFTRAKSFNQDISSWDVSNVKDMSRVFWDAISFNQDISSWNMSNVENIAQMFEGAINFNQDISSWDTSNIQSIGGAFRDAQSFNQDISSWNTLNMKYLSFKNASSFNQDLSSLDFSNIKEVTMEGSNLSTDNYDKLLLTWVKGNIQNNVDIYMGNIKYSKKAENAKFELINNYNWNIQDGGLAE